MTWAERFRIIVPSVGATLILPAALATNALVDVSAKPSDWTPGDESTIWWTALAALAPLLYLAVEYALEAFQPGADEVQRDTKVDRAITIAAVVAIIVSLPLFFLNRHLSDNLINNYETPYAETAVGTRAALKEDRVLELERIIEDSPDSPVVADFENELADTRAALSVAAEFERSYDSSRAYLREFNKFLWIRFFGGVPLLALVIVLKVAEPATLRKWARGQAFSGNRDQAPDV